MAGSRRQSRVLALQALFEMDVTGHDPLVSLGRLPQEKPVNVLALPFAEELVRGVLQHRDAIDEKIRHAAPQWPLEQMAAVDRSVLRLAIFEVLFDNRVPLKAAINEAIELAKRFGSENSAKFVNGVLGGLVAQGAPSRP